MTEYTKQFEIYRHDGDHRGLVKPGALLRYAQQIATEHAYAVGLTDEVYAATHTAFVLAKTALHITRTPRVDETLTLVTQPERTKRAVNKRITRVLDASGAEAALLDSRWVLIDTEKRTILRKHPDQFNIAWAADVERELPMRMTKAAAGDCVPMGERTAAYSLCDMNGHLNNTRYADLLCDALPPEIWDHRELTDLLIFYHREVPRGESFALAGAATAPGQWYFNATRDGLSAFAASLIFTPEQP
ncbi:MAG: acyl-[acyl-carrier-protein] thioesterase [Gemmiger sp.]